MDKKTLREAVEALRDEALAKGEAAASDPWEKCAQFNHANSIESVLSLLDSIPPI